MRTKTVAAVALAAQAVRGQNWDAITPSADLEWHDCLETFKCARLEMPLDWKNESDPRTVAIAMMKKEAAVPVDDPAWGGPIFSNPGGPGHSGVDFIPRYAASMQQKFDKPGEKHYEIVSFDPRGIASSTPSVDCLGSQLQRDAFNLELRGTHDLAFGTVPIAYTLGLFEGLGRKCQDVYDNGLEIFPYLSSASVVRDMVQMVDKAEEWRQGQLRKRGLEVREEKEPRLQFVGFSYGTILANYFASMYPGRVGRIVADGVVDAVDYSSGPGWLTAGLDTDLVFDYFFETCFEAKEGCMLYREEYTSKDDMKKPVVALMDRLNERPIGRVTADGKRAVITGVDLRESFGVFSYSGITGFKQLAVLLDSSLQGDFVPLLTFLQRIREVPELQDACPGTNSTAAPLPPVEYLYSVMCLDGSDVRDEGLDYWVDYVDEQKQVSEIYGATLALVRFGCSGWPFRAKWRFEGPFTTPEADADVVPGKPAAPLLFLSNRRDPVTPLRSARNMAKEHPGAGVVVQESVGHCALLSAPSNCTNDVLREYWDTGKVPSEEKVCEEEEQSWVDEAEPRHGRRAMELHPILPRLPFHPMI